MAAIDGARIELRASMTEPLNRRRPKHSAWTPQPETIALLRVCIAECFWTRPAVQPKPLEMMTHRLDQNRT
jgi:hypothetical protein